MIRGKTGLTTFLDFIEREGRMPTAAEFTDLGYSRQWFYKVRDQYYDYLNARVEEKQEGGNPIATYEDDVAENLIQEDAV